MKLLAFLMITLLLIATPSMAQEKHKESAFDRVMRTGTIKCGYAMWKPVLYQDLNSGKLTGIAHDVMEAVGKRLSLKIDWAEESGWGTIAEGMVTNRYDMACVAIGQTGVRAKAMGFSAPLFYLPMYLVAREDDARFDKGYDILNDTKYKIAVLDGEMSSIVAAQSYPLAVHDAMSQTSDYSLLLKEVETRKADVTMVTPETFADYDHNNPGKLKIVLPSHPINVYPAGFGLPRDDLAFDNMIDATVGELMLDGTVERIIQKYEKVPGTFLRVERPYRIGQ